MYGQNQHPPGPSRGGRCSPTDWPANKQLAVCRDPQIDNVQVMFNGYPIPIAARPKYPCCDMRQTSVECNLNWGQLNASTSKREEQQQAYLGYLEAFHADCVCEAARTSHLIPAVPCDGYVECPCGEHVMTTSETAEPTHMAAECYPSGICGCSQLEMGSASVESTSACCCQPPCVTETDQCYCDYVTCGPDDYRGSCECHPNESASVTHQGMCYCPQSSLTCSCDDHLVGEPNNQWVQCEKYARHPRCHCT